MSALQRAFSRRALIPFITAGDPDLGCTAKLIRTMAESGADMIQLGIPFSDPVVEGPVVQAANVRAMKRAITSDDVFDMIKELRGDCDVPIAVRTYANQVFVYGIDRFLDRCNEVGVCAILIPDIPYEERPEFQGSCRDHGVALMTVITPSHQEGEDMIASDADGFLYFIPSSGEPLDGERLESFITRMRDVSDLPCVIGSDSLIYGVPTSADGVLLVPDVVETIVANYDDPVAPVAKLVAGYRKIIDSL